MDNHDLARQIEELIGQNRTMLEYAEAGHWEKVVEIEMIRRELIKTFFSSPNITSRPDVVNATREMLDINNKLQQLALDAREEVNTRTGSLNKGRLAVNSYIKNIR